MNTGQKVSCCYDNRYAGCCVGRRPISLTQGYLTAPRPLKNPALGLTLIFMSLWDISIKNETTACSVFFGGSLKLAFIQPNAIMPGAWSTAIPGAWVGSDPRGEGRTSICSVQYHHSRASNSLLISQSHSYFLKTPFAICNAHCAISFGVES